MCFFQAKLQQEVLDNHDERHQAEADELRSKLLDMSREKEQEISARRTLENELRKRVAELLEKVSLLETELAKITETNRITVNQYAPFITRQQCYLRYLK